MATAAPSIHQAAAHRHEYCRRYITLPFCAQSALQSVEPLALAHHSIVQCKNRLDVRSVARSFYANIIERVAFNTRLHLVALLLVSCICFEFALRRRGASRRGISIDHKTALCRRSLRRFGAIRGDQSINWIKPKLDHWSNNNECN